MQFTISKLLICASFRRLSRPGSAVPTAVNYDDKAKIDEEYMSLMAELGEGKASSNNAPRQFGGSRFSSGGLFDKSSAPKSIMAGSGSGYPPSVPGNYCLKYLRS